MLFLLSHSEVQNSASLNMGTPLERLSRAEDILNIVFEHLYEFEPDEIISFQLTEEYLNRMDMPWILPSSRGALLACYGVCRTWHRLAGMKLFRCIQIDSEEQLQRLLSALQNGEAASGGFPFVVMGYRLMFPSPSFIKLLQHSPNLKHLAIREISIDWNEDISTIDITPISSSLGNLRSLYLAPPPGKDFIVEYNSDPNQHWVCAVTSLMKSRWMNYHSVFHLLSFAPNLQVLYMRMLFAEHSSSSSHLLPSIKLSFLKSLTVMNGQSKREDLFFNEFRALLGHSDALESLTIFTTVFGSLELQHILSNLENLRLFSKRSIEDMVSLIRLCPLLEHLTIAPYFHQDPDSDSKLRLLFPVSSGAQVLLQSLKSLNFVDTTLGMHDDRIKFAFLKILQEEGESGRFRLSFPFLEKVVLDIWDLNWKANDVTRKMRVQLREEVSKMRSMMEIKVDWFG